MRAVCDRCGYIAPLTGDWFTDGGTMIQHMEDAHKQEQVRHSAKLSVNDARIIGEPSSATSGATEPWDAGSDAPF